MMNRQHKFATWLLLCLATLWLGSVNAEVTNDPAADVDRLNQIFERSTLKIATPDARMHAFSIWLANDDQHRQLGLMYVRKLDENAGMLFVYPTPFRISMWMKNTFIPLDMLFVNAKGKVVQVAERTTPQSLKTISSDTDVVGVIELNAGTAERLHIRPGSQVMHPAFAKQQ
jgi:uncharacterized membrane protein (UPF0127 family)